MNFFQKNLNSMNGQVLANRNKILIFGGAGLVGSKFIENYSQDFEIKAPTASEVDILKKDQISKAVEDSNPDSIINFAAYTNVEEAEAQKDDQEGICFQVNAIGAKNVALACKDFDKNLIHISTEYVFDGMKDVTPYTEEDKPNPVNWYGSTKLFGEDNVLESGCKSCIVRISMPFSAHYDLKKDVARFFLEKLRLGQKVKAIEDQRITPLLVDDIATVLSKLVENKSQGIYHVASNDSVTPLEFVKTMIETFGFDYSLVDSIKLDEYNKGKKAKLLKYSWLNPAKFEKEFGMDILHTVEEALVIFKQKVDQPS